VDATAPEASQMAKGAAAGPNVDGFSSEFGQPVPLSDPSKGASVPKPSESSAILKLKGLPYSTTEQQILQFFGDFKVQCVRFVYEPDGRPSGLAFAEFENKEEALKALSKNGEYIGERYVRLLHVPKSEMEEQVRLGTLAIPGNAAKLRSRLMRQQQRNNLAYLAGPLQLVPTVVPAAGRPLMSVGPTLNAPYATGPTGAPIDARVWPGQAYQASPVALAAQFGNLSIGPTQSIARGPAMHAQPHQGQHPNHGLQQHQQQQQLPGQLQTQQNLLNSRSVQNPTSATVKVRGLPYRSSPAEILTFFQGYQYLPDSLQIGLDSLGRPSGEAWLTFVNPPEALRAVRDLNRHYLGSRYLELSIC